MALVMFFFFFPPSLPRVKSPLMKFHFLLRQTWTTLDFILRGLFRMVLGFNYAIDDGFFYVFYHRQCPCFLNQDEEHKMKGSILDKSHFGFFAFISIDSLISFLFIPIALRWKNNGLQGRLRSLVRYLRASHSYFTDHTDFLANF